MYGYDDRSVKAKKETDTYIMKHFKTAVLTAILISPSAFSQFKHTALPFSYDALENCIDAETMEKHYKVHSAGFVKKLNKAIVETPYEKMSLFQLLSKAESLPSSVKTNAGGLYNHKFFWTVLTPQKNTKPTEYLADAINEKFGGMKKLKEKIIKVSAENLGSGWVWLSVDKYGRLFVSSTSGEENPLMNTVEERGTPILGIDLWDHAYDSDKVMNRTEYITSIWPAINWKEVSNRYDLAQEKY